MWCDQVDPEFVRRGVRTRPRQLDHSDRARFGTVRGVDQHHERGVADVDGEFRRELVLPQDAGSEQPRVLGQASGRVPAQTVVAAEWIPVADDERPGRAGEWRHGWLASPGVGGHRASSSRTAPSGPTS